MYTVIDLRPTRRKNRNSAPFGDFYIKVSLDLLRPFDRLWGVQAQHKSVDSLKEHRVRLGGSRGTVPKSYFNRIILVSSQKDKENKVRFIIH